MFLDDGAMHGAQLGARRLHIRARRQAAEELRHPVLASGHHGGR